MQRLGEERVLNSKAEFNRSKISRLTLGEEDKWKSTESEGRDQDEGDGGVQDWVEGRVLDRRTQELRGTPWVERGLVKSPARKRVGEEEPDPSSSGKKSKYKYPLLEPDWGEEKPNSPPPATAPSPPVIIPPPTPPPPPCIDTEKFVENHTIGEETIPRPTSPTVFHQPMGEHTPPPPTPPLTLNLIMLSSRTNQPPQTTKNPPTPSPVDGHWSPTTQLEDHFPKPTASSPINPTQERNHPPSTHPTSTNHAPRPNHGWSPTTQEHHNTTTTNTNTPNHHE